MTKLDGFVSGVLVGALPVWMFCKRQLLWRALRLLAGNADDPVEWGSGYRTLNEIEGAAFPLVGMSHFLGLSIFLGASVLYARDLYNEGQHLAAYVVTCLPAAAFFGFGFWRLAAFAGRRGK
jgi:hypothetical protein